LTALEYGSAAKMKPQESALLSLKVFTPLETPPDSWGKVMKDFTCTVAVATVGKSQAPVGPCRNGRPEHLLVATRRGQQTRDRAAGQRDHHRGVRQGQELQGRRGHRHTDRITEFMIAGAEVTMLLTNGGYPVMKLLGGRHGGRGGGRKRRKSGALAPGPGLAVVAAGDAGDTGACCPRWARWQDAQRVNGVEGRAAEPHQRILPPAVRRLGAPFSGRRPAPDERATFPGPVVQEGNTTQNLCHRPGRGAAATGREPPPAPPCVTS
jgi:hypothetical protein